MTPQGLREKLRRVPFQPLRIHTVGGATYDVTEPGDMYVTNLEVGIGIDPDDSGLPQNTAYMAPNHVARVVPIKPEPPEEMPDASGGNGRAD